MSSPTFSDAFRRMTNLESPRRWQEQLAATTKCEDRLIRIPTGLGKTEGVLAAWCFHRIERSDAQWPCRLIWCLPMRALVEQTAETARRMASRCKSGMCPSVHLALGGEDDQEWYLYPEKPTIIVGTQDMLLSRALNRGYSSARGRWPTEFGLLNQDALWVMDEVQLMDVGLATSAQLQAYRRDDASKGLRPCRTWWMSATLQPQWLHTVDTEQYHSGWTSEPCVIPPAQRQGDLWQISKPRATGKIDAKDSRRFAERVLSEHARLSAGRYGRITLVVCNTVERASQTYDALRELGRKEGIELIHSRFRPHERERWRAKFLSREHCQAGVDRIIVATQVVEAGVDISAGCLITELAPWPSLVQRFGRCARYGGNGTVVVIDRGRDAAAPYEAEQLAAALDALNSLTYVSVASLETFEESLSAAQRVMLFPYDPKHLLLRREFEELFDTTPDLTGADVDVSRFIRTGEERDLQVFWLEIPAPVKGQAPPSPPDGYQPHRRELCSVAFLKARDWLFEKGLSKLRKNKRAWVWDWIEGKWVVATREALVPGRIVCVAADSGGYQLDRGLAVDSPDAVPPVLVDLVRSASSDAAQDGEVKGEAWKRIATHTREVAETLDEILSALPLPDTGSIHILQVLRDSVLWHDWGKAHPAFQGCMRDWPGRKRLPDLDLAKAPAPAWSKRHRYKYLDGLETRPAFRHELASALGLFALLRACKPDHSALLGPWKDVLTQLHGSIDLTAQVAPSSDSLRRLLDYSADEFNLLVYLVAAHHGKVRVALHAAPADQEYRDRDGRGLPIRGVREGDRLPCVVLVPGEPPVPEVTLTLAPASLGLSGATGISWRERVIKLLADHGPTKLAYLEALLVAADRRASRLTTPDPLLTPEAAR